jgi:SHS2 domain-containing protein
MPYRTIDHTADLGIVVQAVSVESLLKEAARALSELIVGKRVFKSVEEIRISVSGSDWPDLMINWLRELLYQWNGKNRVPGPVDIRKMERFALEAAVMVDNTPCEPHDVLNDIKAVTYHQISVENQAADWQARIIFDI